MEEKTEAMPLTEGQSEPIYVDYNSEVEHDGFARILFMQFTVCIILLLFVFVLNIIKGDTLSGISRLFTEYSCCETEEVYCRIADAAVSLIYD